MKIGIYDPYLDGLSGGEKYILTLALCFAKTHDVRIFWDRGEEQLIKEKAKRKLNLDLSELQFSKNIFSKDVSFVRRLFLSNSYDYIIFLSDGSIPFVLSKLLIHFQFPVQWINAKTIKTKIKMKRVAKVICNSFFTKKYIDEKFHIVSAVLYPPVELISREKVKKENIIINVGRYGNYEQGSSYKKQEFIVKTFRKMIEKGLKNWRLVLVVSTREEDEAKLEKLIEEAERFPVTVVKNPDNLFLQKQYAKAKIYWHAAGYGEDLKKHPERAEHFGIPTVEAMSAGAVPVVIRTGGQPEIVNDGDNGFLWITQEELIEKTNLIINDENVWSKMSKSAEKRAEFFSNNNFCNNLEKII